MNQPFFTAVLITDSASASSWLLHGLVIERRRHPKGWVALLPPGEIVFYAFRARKLRTFIFRTLGRPEMLASEIPGVSPHVRLLLHTQTYGRLRRLEELLRHLARTGHHPSSLSDRFYSRLHAILSGRLRQGKVLRSLLADEEPAAARA